jgi:serine/threonine-protein kinase
MLTGESLFGTVSAVQSLEAIKKAPIRPPSTLRPEVPEVVDRIVMSALQRDPARRTPTAGAFADQLEAIANRMRGASKGDAGHFASRYANEKINMMRASGPHGSVAAAAGEEAAQAAEERTGERATTPAIRATPHPGAALPTPSVQPTLIVDAPSERPPPRRRPWLVSLWVDAVLLVAAGGIGWLLASLLGQR